MKEIVFIYRLDKIDENQKMGLISLPIASPGYRAIALSSQCDNNSKMHAVTEFVRDLIRTCVTPSMQADLDRYRCAQLLVWSIQTYADSERRKGAATVVEVSREL